MKALIALSVFGLFSLPTYAQGLKGVLEGSCTLTTSTSTKTLSFSVPNNKKAVTNLSDALFIEVANNLGSKTGLYGAAHISISRKDGTFRNPPELCPSWPLDLKEACEARNAANTPEKVTYPEDSFALVKHNGAPDSIWITFDNSGPISMTFARVELSREEAVQGDSLVFPSYDLNGTTISCSSTFIKE